LGAGGPGNNNCLTTEGPVWFHAAVVTNPLEGASIDATVWTEVDRYLVDLFYPLDDALDHTLQASAAAIVNGG